MLLELVDSVTLRFRHLRRREKQGAEKWPGDNKTGHFEREDAHHMTVQARAEDDRKAGTKSAGAFSGAHNFSIDRPVMVDMTSPQINYYFSSGTPVLHSLLPHIIQGAGLDSSARHPPPLCHPGTRQRIQTTLESWLRDPHRQWNMIWLSGPAGVGKSAVAQTFAERCVENGRLGTAFFFSRPNHRNNPRHVVPTLAYQLAVRFPEYKNLLANQIANDPTILEATTQMQFRKLIIEPFSIMQIQRPAGAGEPYLIVLDGLDECEGEDAQCEIIEMIGDVIRLKKDLPLLWLVCSRPEPHLKYTFSKTDYSINCGREELVIDDESRGEVDQYLRDGFKNIQAKFWDILPSAPWPSEEQFFGVSNAASGLFIVASTALKYIGDSEHADPAARLEYFLFFIKKSRGVGANSPLEALDLLYTRILSSIPGDVLPTTRRILFHLIYVYKLYRGDLLRVAQTLCNFLRLDQSAFYRALRKLHSVLEVPSPETATGTPLRFYHASFEEYLCDPMRSGKFFLDKQEAFVEISKSLLYWHEIDTTLYHNDGEIDKESYPSHNHAPLPNLKWVSESTETEISEDIATVALWSCWRTCTSVADRKDQGLLSQIRHFDFRYIEYVVDEIIDFADWLYRQTSGDPCDAIIRTEPCNVVDQRMLNNLELLVNSEAVKPASFPIQQDRDDDGSCEREYFFMGHGVKACIVCVTKTHAKMDVEILNSDRPPSRSRILQYRKSLEEE